MANQITVVKEHNLGLAAAKEIIEKEANKLKENGIEWQWSGDKIVCQGVSGKVKGCEGVMLINETTVKIVIKLNFMASMFSGMIEDKIKEGLDEYISAYKKNN